MEKAIELMKFGKAKTALRSLIAFPSEKELSI